MDLQQFNNLFLRVIELIISMLAYAIAITGGPLTQHHFFEKVDLNLVYWLFAFET